MDYPADWATAQNNLGNAYGSLPTGDRSENLKSAIACYQAALRVRTEKDHPAYWAGTQNNLGTAYEDLPIGDPAENLRLAAACFSNALKIYIEAGYPEDHARALGNLRRVEDRLKGLEGK